jgi:hypothetical protein
LYKTAKIAPKAQKEHLLNQLYKTLTGEELFSSTEEKPSQLEIDLKNIMDSAEKDNIQFKEMTVTEFKEQFEVLSGYSVNQIGVALRKIGFVCEMKYTKGTTQRIYILPFFELCNITL